MEVDAAWLEEVRKVTREARTQIDERYAAVLGRGADLLIQDVFPLLAGMVEGLTREGINVSVETRMGRQNRFGSGDTLGDLPGGVISTRLPSGQAGPKLTIWVGLAEIPAGKRIPRVVIRAGEVEDDVYSEDKKRTAERARQVILAFVEQVAEADRRSGLERRTLDRISRDFPRAP